MLPGGPVAALIDIGAQRPGKGKVRPEEAQEGQGNAPADLPALRGQGRTDSEKGAGILPVKGDAVGPAGAEAEMEAALRVELEIEVTGFPSGMKKNSRQLSSWTGDRGASCTARMFFSCARRQTYRYAASWQRRPEARMPQSGFQRIRLRDSRGMLSQSGSPETAAMR